MITDLFSHKIHSSGTDWADKVVELASVFNEFDGEVYNRSKIEKKLLSISPRAALAPRDASKFRDEISAYPAYLGLYHLLPSPEGWRIIISKTAKAFLLKEEPDVGSFMRLQLSLFQYPNGMGAAYKPGTNKVRIQANASGRTLDFISSKIHLSPLRLIIQSLMADAELRDVNIFESFISFEEVIILANSNKVNRDALPNYDILKKVLKEIRINKIRFSSHFERRFHILNHTEMFSISRGGISFRKPCNSIDDKDLTEKIFSILNINVQFDGFDKAKNSHDIEKAIITGAWANYFDGINTISADIINVLATDVVSIPNFEFKIPKEEIRHEVKTYSLTDRKEYMVPRQEYTRKSEFADPEITRIKRQRRNLAHKLILDKMSSYLMKMGAEPKENPHIDLYAEIPRDGAYLFEIKSGGENLLDQIRKGISQLYEYRFRYKDVIRKDTILCLVVPDDPDSIPWLHEYICIDRDICMCWFDNDEKIVFPVECKDKMEAISLIG